MQHRLGVGGEGEVWAAATPGGEVRALKLIRPDVVAEPVAFARRTGALALIDDPALVRVLDGRVLATGDWAGWGAMVMELIEGEPLDDAHLGAAAFADLEPLAWALDRLHDGTWSDGEPLVHRDVKPANLIRARDDRVVLVDPSTLRAVGGDMTYVGTPLFVAPEVPSGRFGPTADVYSFAATLLALHSGARGDDLAALLADPRALDVPEPLIRALSADPAERPPRCVDLVDTTDTLILRSVAVDEPEVGPQTARTWWRLGLLTVAALPVVGGLLLPSVALALTGLATIAGLLAIDPAARDSTLPWLPLACARWLVRTLDADDAEREQVAATLHGALLLPFAPLVAVLGGLGPRIATYGTIGQIMGVGLICALALVWFALVTSDDGRRWPPARIVLLPVWAIGIFAQVVARIALAVNDALQDAERRTAAGGADHTPDSPDRQAAGGHSR